MRMCSVENVTATVPSLSHTVPVWQMHGGCMARTRMACAVPATLAVISSDLLSNKGQSIQSREALRNECALLHCRLPGAPARRLS